MTSQYDMTNETMTNAAMLTEGGLALDMAGLDLTRAGAYGEDYETGDVFEALTQTVRVRRAQDGKLKFSDIALSVTRTKPGKADQNLGTQTPQMAPSITRSQLLRRVLAFRLAPALRGRVLIWLDTEKALARSGLLRGVHLQRLNDLADGLIRTLNPQLTNQQKITIDPGLKYLRAGRVQPNVTSAYKSAYIDRKLAPATALQMRRTFAVLKTPSLTIKQDVENRVKPEVLLSQETQRLVPQGPSRRGQVRSYKHYEVLKQLETMEPKPAMKAAKKLEAEMPEPSGSGARANVVSFADYKRRKYAELKLDA